MDSRLCERFVASMVIKGVHLFISMPFLEVTQVLHVGKI